MLESSKAIIFDLDDTLVDTFSLLIVPLERKAAGLISRNAALPIAEPELFKLLIALRKSSPTSIPDVLSCLSGQLQPHILKLYNSVFDDFDISPLVIGDCIKQKIVSLRGEYHTILLTEGRISKQTEKLRWLGLEKCFDTVQIIDTNSDKTKKDYLTNFATSFSLAYGDLLVVGNRIDNEILAGLLLGTKTLWVSYGEGGAIRLPHVLKGLSGSVSSPDELATYDFASLFSGAK